MSATKEFFMFLSKDKDAQLELSIATVRALKSLLAQKGFGDEAKKVIDEVAAKTANAHGFDLKAMEELDAEELQAVAGGQIFEGKEEVCGIYVDEHNCKGCITV